MRDLEDIPDNRPLGVQNDGEPEVVTPAEPVAEEPKAEAPEPEAPTSEDAEAEKVLDEHEEPKKRSGVARLKAKLEFERAEKERIARELEAIRQAQAPAPKAERPVGRPQLDQFQTYDEYEVARDEWVAEEAVRRFQERSQKEAAEKEFKTLDQAWKQKVRALQAKDDDFDEGETLQALNSAGVVIHPVMAEAIYTSDAGPELLKYLGDNTDEARRIAALSPARAARELGRIESRLVGAVEKAQPKPKTSQAPPPIPPVAARGGVAVSNNRYAVFEDF